jgi:hypothetical protein
VSKKKGTGRIAGTNSNLNGAPALKPSVCVAQQTGARIEFIEDATPLEPYGGVAAKLRFRI